MIQRSEGEKEALNADADSASEKVCREEKSKGESERGVSVSLFQALN